MERCSKMSAGAASSLPDDPLVEILSRVPAKSICRFKCVSKAWRDLIADPDHRKKLPQAMQGLFVQTAEIPEFDRTKSAYISFSISFLDLTARPVPLDIDPCFSFLTELFGTQNLFLLESCNGLILFKRNEDPSHSHLPAGGYIVCNPTLKQWSAVPACGSPTAFCHAHLAFDPAISCHFHLVQFEMPRLGVKIVSFHVYSSETRIWSQNHIDEQRDQGQLEGWHHRFTRDTIHSQCAFVNGFLHLIVWRSYVQQILAVDVQGKSRRMITVLPGMSDGSPQHAFACYLGQSQGHLHCVTVESPLQKNQKLSTWVLQDYNTQEWVLKNTLNSLDVFGETREVIEFQVIGIHQDCNLVFFFHKLSSEVIAYNMDRKEASVIATFEARELQPEFAFYIPYFQESPGLTNKH